METIQETPVNALPPAVEPSQTVFSDNKDIVKGLLAEARATREMLLDLMKAVENGTYQGHQMLSIAKGISFLQAIANQNKAHIDDLQRRLEAK